MNKKEDNTKSKLLKYFKTAAKCKTIDLWKEKNSLTVGLPITSSVTGRHHQGPKRKLRLVSHLKPNSANCYTLPYMLNSTLSARVPECHKLKMVGVFEWCVYSKFGHHIRTPRLHSCQI